MALLPDGAFGAATDLDAIRRTNWVEQAIRLSRSVFYAEHLNGYAIPAEIDGLGELPFTNKAMLRGDQAKNPPFGRYLATQSANINRIHRTSGTSGQAMNVALSARDAHVTAVIASRAQSGSGIGPGDTVIHCLNYQMWMGGLTDHLGLEATGATVIPFGVGNSRLLVETIMALNVTAISCTPSYPAALERVMAKEFEELSPRDLGLSKGLFGGEAGLDSPDFRSRLEKVWGLKPFNSNYGVSDVFCNFAGQCEDDNDLHFMAADVLHAELIDPESDKSVALSEGNTGELVLTHLERECQPLIRFKTGDIVEITGTETCSCRRTGFRFRVIGRSDDMVVVRGINVFPTMIAACLDQIDGLNGEYRIVVDEDGPIDRLRVDVEVVKGFAGDDAFSRQIEAQIKSSLGVSASVTIVADGALPRTGGKTRRVIRKEKP